MLVTLVVTRSLVVTHELYVTRSLYVPHSLVVTHLFRISRKHSWPKEHILLTGTLELPSLAVSILENTQFVTLPLD